MHTAEAAYGIPDDIKQKAYSYLDEPLKDVLRRWKTFIHSKIALEKGGIIYVQRNTRNSYWFPACQSILRYRA